MVEMFNARFEQYERVEKMFTKFFDAEELQKVFDDKASLIQLSFVEANAATKEELKSFEPMLDGLNDRIK